MKFDIIVNKENMQVRSIGAESSELYNIITTVATDEFIEAAKEFIAFTLEYQIENRSKIIPGHTMTYGFWLVKFEESNSNLEVWELDKNANLFIKGANLTLQFWMEQLCICDELNAEFDPPTADKLITLSKEILEDESEIQGVRMIGEDNSSGWLLYKNEDDLDELNYNKLVTIHLHELISKKPDLVCFFGLPYGYRFIIEDDGYDVWFDSEAIK
ncbi:hypothetical protein ABES38_07205 [Bacillus gobiensis]|uniref:immunity protein Imm33 domain-containing protein n=1 Tax=Bacillus gobiensis TaxID=1441095 RepID=UPI003D1B05BF